MALFLTVVIVGLVTLYICKFKITGDEGPQLVILATALMITDILLFVLAMSRRVGQDTPKMWYVALAAAALWVIAVVLIAWREGIHLHNAAGITSCLLLASLLGTFASNGLAWTGAYEMLTMLSGGLLGITVALVAATTVRSWTSTHQQHS